MTILARDIMAPGGLMKLAWLALFLIGCTRPNPEVCCTGMADCAMVGIDEDRPCSSALACVDHRCVPPSDPENTDSQALDAPAVRAFDIAYPYEWKFSVAGPISGYMLFVNTSANPLDMSTLELKSIDDDNPTAIVRITPSPVDTSIPAGSAGGSLSGLSEALLVDTGLVSEPRVDTTSSYLSLEVQNAPPGNYDISVNALLALETVPVPISMTIHVVDTQIIFADPLAAKRTPIYR